jgi:hypothetical protein
MKITLRSQLVYLALPLLFAAYPVIFLYSVNAKTLQLSSMVFPLGASFLVTIVVYAFFRLLQRNPVSAGLSTAVFMIAFYLYGGIYQWLIQWDRFRVQHFILLPLAIAIVIYASFLTTLIKRPLAAQIHKILALVSLVLVAYNLVIILSVEVQKNLHQSASMAAVTSSPVPAPTATSVPLNEKYPDIYFIIFDEYAGFDAIHGYWHDDTINTFEDFLAKNHFFVANGSRSVTINTQTEISSRFNLHQYYETDDPEMVLDQLDHNKVMQVLKSYGYQTVVMDMAFSKIESDINIQFDPKQVGGLATDEYKQTFINDTMFSAFSEYFNFGSTAQKQRDMILFALDKTTNLPPVKSPKFVYTHVLLPHEPFIFDENGGLISPEHADDWSYYLGQHRYTTKLAQDLMTRLLKNADPANPPVIILQSDHGARNLASRTQDNIYTNGYLQNYPGEYAHDILNALYLPGFDTSTLSPNMPPNDTFAIVLNHYLNAGLQVDPTDR